MPYSASEDKWGLFNAKDERKADFQVPTKTISDWKNAMGPWLTVT